MKKILVVLIGIVLSFSFATGLAFADGKFTYTCTDGPHKDEVKTSTQSQIDAAAQCNEGAYKEIYSEHDSKTNISTYGLKGTGNGNLVVNGSKKYCNVGKLIETNIFGDICDINGTAMFYFINVVLQVLTYGVGVGGVVGIVISGIQYLTARDNEAQAAKARRRILEVVIGLVVYAVMYVVLKFLLIPGGID